MSVLIKGMEMPKSCWDCYFQDCGNCVLNAYKAVDKFIIEDHIDDECPLVPVPTPHGRLIDADKLKADNPRHMNVDVPYVTEVTVEEIIDEAPTVIEADE